MWWCPWRARRRETLSDAYPNCPLFWRVEVVVVVVVVVCGWMDAGMHA